MSVVRAVMCLWGKEKRGRIGKRDGGSIGDCRAEPSLRYCPTAWLKCRAASMALLSAGCCRSGPHNHVIGSTRSKSHIGADLRTFLRSQNATSTSGRGGRRHLPYAFTEHGALMLASVLNSPRAAEMSIFVVRAFVRLRQLLATHADLARKLEELEKKYDAKFTIVFDAIRRLMTPDEPQRRRIGFEPADNNKKRPAGSLRSKK